MTTTPARSVQLRYAARSEVSATALASDVRVALDGGRGTVGVRGRVKDPALFRDTLMAAAAILQSDLRYKGRDRTAYLAYLMKQGKKATAAIWEAQKAFLDKALDEDTKTSGALDPVLTVHPDEVSLEVFSRDESAYARVAFASDLFEGREAAHGTTFADLSPELIAQVDRLRPYAAVDLDAGVSVAGRAPGEDRPVSVPYTWLRGFLQVQSAATLPAVTCELQPVDLYNALFTLRTRKAKTSPRGLRFELVPGRAPRMIVEPWEIVLESHGPAFKGAPRVVRTFGRQRLLTLARVLPHAKRVRVQLRGPGLPVFWVIDLGKATLTAAMTGWTESSWASAASFDALMPHSAASEVELGALATRLSALLVERGPLGLSALSEAAGVKTEAVRAAMQLECLRGRAIFDVAREVYRPRALFTEAVDEQLIRYGSPREARAHRLLGTPEAPGAGEVKITKIHEIAGEGVEIHGQVTDLEARREFPPHFTMDLEGRVSDASCTCPTFRRSGLREGPCEHMIALRLAYARKRVEEDALRQTEEGRQLIRAETRTYVRRDESGAETVYRVSLDDRVVYVQWGARSATGWSGAAATAPVESRASSVRHQRIWFDTDREARDAYFRRLEDLASEGFVDADAASA
ncbi:SWIM zinc finger family protein [Chondromyces apiculatus]|uniref:SWIM zinc finger domain protein n=1 Tax=Chondromyces apiculatus DSM 436 TaxID=1192034 RepID=A0A017T0Q0_9BACT|nr:SWIM zinc finger family protein [Chondromyces apiculatus]EYF02440.1 SWIM zinc finger domain protein [Chondromyces apiculatus DSM 436]